MTLVKLELLRRQIVRVAESNLGYGESEGNNRGPFLRAIGAPDGSAWCSWFAWYCYRRGAEYAELELPFRGSGNAKRFGAAIQACSMGFSTTDPWLALPGDLVVLHRGHRDTERGPGHVRVVTATALRGRGGRLRLAQIDGNSGGYPAVVRRVVTDPRRERLVGIYGLRVGGA